MADLGMKESLAELFREVFEGVTPGSDGTWFVQGKEAIFDAWNSLTPEQGSRRVPGQPSSIGAHLHHLTYYLSLFNSNLRGESPKGDWEGSWLLQEFDDAAWNSLSERMAKEYRLATDWYNSAEPLPDQDTATYAAANLAHAAYHLGAVRALMPIVLAD